jgi:hypothetical protein
VWDDEKFSISQTFLARQTLFMASLEIRCNDQDVDMDGLPIKTVEGEQCKNSMYGRGTPGTPHA